MRTELHARIGRTMPSPLFGVLVEVSTVDVRARDTRLSPPPIPRALGLLGVLLVALWPHWSYVARRLVDGSDEPWGLLALLTVIALLVRDRASLERPTRSALIACAALAVAAAFAHLVLPDLAAAAVAMLALGLYLVHALRRPAAPLIVLLLLALPIIASLQFYLGFPLRLLVAHATSGLLTLGGIDATAAGASIVHDGATVLIDPPCAGIGMLWLGSYSAAVLSYMYRADARTTLINGAMAGLLVLLANVARNTVLFFPEAALVSWPAWTHDAVGLAAFTVALVPLMLFITAVARSFR
jgi:exosortase/archaeosortase family protein